MNAQSDSLKSHFNASMARQQAIAYTERGELSNIVTDIYTASKLGHMSITVQRSIWQTTINQLRELGYKVEENMQHEQCSISTSISWNEH